ncbi:RNA polymerase II-associated protein 3-like [Tubulanus polymorphus]|uniref:RNA polymerase II-associated protein 3-like n=1 Tax=Tubulanus polymorphus TaxID=672921 RepID=UPI003DA670AB
MSGADKMIELQKNLRQNQAELGDFLKDLDSWQNDIQKKDEALKKNTTAADVTEKLPPVRNSLDQKKKVRKKKKKKQENPKKNDKISGFDFRAWDKFDVDKALNDIDEQKENAESSEYETDEEWEMERIKQQATLQKDRGNQLFKEGCFDEAIDCYTKGMQCDPTNAILPANRAMALIKQEKFAAAELDCTEAVMLDPTYVKAYSRRAHSRMSLSKYELAKSDFETVLELEPNNKQAKAELDKIDKILNPKPQGQSITEGTRGLVKAIYKHPDKRSKKPLVRIEIEEIGESEEEKKIRMKIADAQASRGDAKQKVTQQQNVEFENKFLSVKNKDPGNREKKLDRKTKGDEINVAQKTDRIKTLSAPETPTTSFQFQTDWKVVSNDSELFYKYMKKIDPKTFPKLFGQFLDANVLLKILSVLKDYYVPDNEDIFQHLKYLSNVKRFSMTVLFLSPNEQKVISALFEHLKSGSHSRNEIEELAKLYGL